MELTHQKEPMLPSEAMSNADSIMRDAGYVTSAVAAYTLGVALQTIHRRINAGRLVGSRCGRLWYVTITSMLEANKDNAVIHGRIKALDIKAVA